MNNNVDDDATYWTDDVPVCNMSGVGTSTNQVYRKDGTRREEHEFEDTSFHFRVDGDYLYGVMDGHNGGKASKFAAQRFPAEVLLGQLQKKNSPQEIENVLRHAFNSVEKGFNESLDDLLTERTKLKMDLPKEVIAPQDLQQYSQMLHRLEELDKQLDGGSMAVVALIKNSRLYIANIGCSRAVVCRQGADGQMWVDQLTVDHDLNNDLELQRLLTLGLDVEKLRQVGKLGSRPYTRTIGDILVKTCYKEFDVMGCASSEPVLATPDIVSYDLDPSCMFMFLMSDGVYRSLQTATKCSQVNADIANMLATELLSQTTLNGVVQAVIDRIVRTHHQVYMTSIDPGVREACQRRDDMTLLIRTFTDAPPAMALFSPLSVLVPESDQYQSTGLSPQLQVAAFHQASLYPINPGDQWTPTVSHMSTDSAESTSGGEDSLKARGNPLPLDPSGRLQAYVDFTEWHQAMSALSSEQLEELERDLEPRPDFEPILEETGVDEQTFEC